MTPPQPPPRPQQPERVPPELQSSHEALVDRLRAAVRMEPETLPPGGTRRAAVLLLFDASVEDLPLLFILRSAGLRAHAGQIAFPGGAEEAGDSDIVATALREAHEEVALDPDNVEVIGVLPSFLTAVSQVWLTPVVGLQRNPWPIRTDEVEVAEWFWVDLNTLMSAPHHVRDIPREGRGRAVHFYEMGPRVIWGVSAAILHELLSRLGRDN
jgi:8-oxo-dGTP pyrophosphatase MutT (NUDIX family)